MSAHGIFDVDIHLMTRGQEFMTGVKPKIDVADGRHLARGRAHKAYGCDGVPEDRGATPVFSQPVKKRDA
jgi:hypothetical protein